MNPGPALSGRAGAPLSSPVARQHRPGLGIALILLAATTFSMLDTGVKFAGAFAPVLFILWVRYGVQAVAMFLWLLLRRGPGSLRAGHPRFQFVRGTLLLLTSAFTFFALQYLPVAEFTAITMLTPVVVTLLAGWLLHERVTRLRWLLVCGGFAGALIVIRPGSGLFGWAVLLPLAGALCYASFQVLTSKLAGLENPYTTHFYTGLTGAVLLTPLLWLLPAEVVAGLAPSQWLLLGVLGLLGTVGHLFLILALGNAPTATLMPFLYGQIAAAALAGWVVFDHVPDGWAWVGMAVIAVCGAGSVALNRRPAALPAAASPRPGTPTPAPD